MFVSATESFDTSTFRNVTVTEPIHPLVDQATFDQVGAIMDARGEDHTRRASNASDYHLTGRIRCPQCGKALIGTAAHGRSKTYRHYTCFSRARYGTTTCDAQRINASTRRSSMPSLASTATTTT